MKRLIDTAVVLITSPIWIVVAIFVAMAILVAMGRPVFYVSARAGLNGVPFRFLKFRTMRAGNEPDSERLTRLGRVLRGFSLDELPQLYHVLVGEMALVGPRPLPVEYLPRYNPTQARRHEVRPGITGLAQVNGRNTLTWDEKFAFDVWYVDHHSLALDAKILALTVIKTLFRAGISHQGYDTMYEFKGGDR